MSTNKIKHGQPIPGQIAKNDIIGLPAYKKRRTLFASIPRRYFDF
jgi:hypothetical protein